MLGKLWRWLKRWLQRWRKSPRPETARPQPAAPVRPAATRADAEYEALFLNLLDQLQPDWGYGQIQGWLLAHALKPAELALWLERFGQRLLASPEPNFPLAEHLVQFSQIDRTELGRVAGEIGRELLERNVSVNEVENEPVAVDENVGAQAEAFFYEGLKKAKADDFEGAIALWYKAIELKPDFHEAWCNRGIAFSRLGRHEEAISSHDKAIEYRSDDHEAWYNRGNALSNLGRKEEAISSYDKAIEFKPDFHEAWYNRGVALFKLRRYDEAIESFERSLSIEPTCWEAWLSLGLITRLLHETIDPSSNIISSSNSSSNRPEEQAISIYQEGLQHIHLGTDPEGYGQLHHAIGNAYFSLAQSQPRPMFFYDAAIEHYEAALQTLFLSAFPKEHLEVKQALGKVYFHTGRLDDFRAVQNYVQHQGWAGFRRLLNHTPSPEIRRQLEAEFSKIIEKNVDTLIKIKEFTIALEAAEWNKNRCLTWILDAWKERVVSPSYAEMRQLLRPQTAILYWHQSDDALTTFLLLPDQAQPQLLATDTGLLRQRQRQFSQWQTDWNRDYRDYRAKKDEDTDPASAKANHIWRRELPQRLTQLREILGIPTLEQQLAGLDQSITHLILVPHRDLHRFPIHALFTTAFTCTYLPSLQIGLNLQTRSAIDLQTASLLSVADPQSDREEMVYAQIESAVIQQYFARVTALSPQQASQASVTSALQQACDLFHFTGHGSHDDQNPQNSALGLTDGETLTAREISQLPLQTCYLASIAACETALTSRQSIDTEYVGLVSAFMQAGTAHVLSTLWNVEEISSTWLMIRFYQQLLGGSLPSQALQQAQQWLRAVTPTELAAWLQNLAALNLSSSIREYLRQEAERIRESITMNSDQPYAHPYYWSAFTLTGAAPQ